MPVMVPVAIAQAVVVPVAIAKAVRTVHICRPLVVKAALPPAGPHRAGSRIVGKTARASEVCTGSGASRPGTTTTTHCRHARTAAARSWAASAMVGGVSRGRKRKRDCRCECQFLHYDAVLMLFSDSVARPEDNEDSCASVHGSSAELSIRMNRIS